MATNPPPHLATTSTSARSVTRSEAAQCRASARRWCAYCHGIALGAEGDQRRPRRRSRSGRSSSSTTCRRRSFEVVLRHQREDLLAQTRAVSEAQFKLNVEFLNRELQDARPPGHAGRLQLRRAVRHPRSPRRRCAARGAGGSGRASAAACTIRGVDEALCQPRPRDAGARRRSTSTVERGEFVALVGPSGCGKSTLLNMVAGILPPSAAGRSATTGARSHGINRARRLHDAGRQRAAVAHGRGECRAAAALPRRADARSAGARRASCSAASTSRGFERSFPFELSGGMRKRVALAQVLVYDPGTLLMDEPFGALDAQLKLLMQAELLRIWEASGKTIVFVTHDLAEAVALADRVVVFTGRPGRIKAIEEWRSAVPARSLQACASLPDFQALYERLWEELAPEIAQGRGDVRRRAWRARRSRGDRRRRAAAAQRTPSGRAALAILVGAVAVGVVFLGFWQFASGRLIDPFFVSSPSAVAQRLWRWTDRRHAAGRISRYTLYATALGFMIGALVGFALGLALRPLPDGRGHLRPLHHGALLPAEDRARAALHHLVRHRHRIQDRDVGHRSCSSSSSSTPTPACATSTRSSSMRPASWAATSSAVLRHVMLPSAASWVSPGSKVSVPYALDRHRGRRVHVVEPRHRLPHRAGDRPVRHARRLRRPGGARGRRDDDQRGAEAPGAACAEMALTLRREDRVGELLGDHHHRHVEIGARHGRHRPRRRPRAGPPIPWTRPCADRRPRRDRRPGPSGTCRRHAIARTRARARSLERVVVAQQSASDRAAGRRSRSTMRRSAGAARRPRAPRARSAVVAEAALAERLGEAGIARRREGDRCRRRAAASPPARRIKRHARDQARRVARVGEEIEARERARSAGSGARRVDAAARMDLVEPDQQRCPRAARSGATPTLATATMYMSDGGQPGWSEL